MIDENPLDDFQETVNNRNTKLCLRALLVSLFCFFLIVTLTRFKTSHLVWSIALLIGGLGLIVSNITGMIYSIKSIRNKEINSAIKVIGIVGNVIFFLIFMKLIIVLIKDVSHFF